MNYIGYDRDPKLSEVENWDQIKFHTVVINHTLMYLDEDEICKLFLKLNSNPVLEQVIFGIGRQNILSNIGKKLLGKQNAHSGTLTGPKEQKKYITEHFDLIGSKSVFYMTDVILVQPKKET